MSCQSINLYDGKTLQTFKQLTDKQLEAALATAADCFENWRRTTFAERAVVVEKAVETGMVFINHPTWTTPDLPFGGIKNSGYGRELSSLGIQEFVNKKLVRVESIDAPA